MEELARLASETMWQDFPCCKLIVSLADLASYFLILTRRLSAQLIAAQRITSSVFRPLPARYVELEISVQLVGPASSK